MTYSFLDEGLEDLEFSIKLAPVPFNEAQTQLHESKMQRRINGVTKGLLEVSTIGRYRVGRSQKMVEFLHRTLRDFLRTKDAQSNLNTLTPETFNISLVLSRALLARLKTSPSPGIVPGIECVTAMEAICNVLNFASFAEEEREVSDRPTLTELASAGKKRYHYFTESPTDFLEYAVRKGLVIYVREEISQQPQLVSSHGGSLLAAALGISQHVAHTVPIESKITSMLKMMLRHGVSPKTKIGKVHVLHEYLDAYRNNNLTRDFSDLLEILLFSAGIDSFAEILKDVAMIFPSSTSWMT